MTLARESMTRSIARRSNSYFRQKDRVDSAKRAKPILVVEDVYKYFRRDVPTLKNVNLKIDRGEFVFVTGPSGAGKSTAIALVCRFYSLQPVFAVGPLYSGYNLAREPYTLLLPFL